MSAKREIPRLPQNIYAAPRCCTPAEPEFLRPREFLLVRTKPDPSNRDALVEDDPYYLFSPRLLRASPHRLFA
jgi:hypothetical protein